MCWQPSIATALLFSFIFIFYLGWLIFNVWRTSKQLPFTSLFSDRWLYINKESALTLSWSARHFSQRWWGVTKMHNTVGTPNNFVVYLFLLICMRTNPIGVFEHFLHPSLLILSYFHMLDWYIAIVLYIAEWGTPHMYCVVQSWLILNGNSVCKKLHWLFLGQNWRNCHQSRSAF